MEDAQKLIESSKFELDNLKVDELQKLTGEAQIIFLLLLTLARQRQNVTHPDVVHAAEVGLDDSMATVLEALAAGMACGSQPTAPNLDALMESLDRAVAGSTGSLGETTVSPALTEHLAVYHVLVATIKRFSPELLKS